MTATLAKLRTLAGKVRVWGVAGIAAYVRRILSQRRHRHRLLAMHRRAGAVSPVRGVTVIGDLTEQAAICKTLRDFVLALREAGIPCQTYDTTPRPRIPREDAAAILTPPEDFSLHRYSHFVAMFRCPLTPEITAGHTYAKIVFHDSQHGIHETSPDLRESGDAIIAMSDFNYEYFARSFSSQKVFKITYPFRFRAAADATPRDELRRRFSIAPDAFVVFFNFDFGSYYRKNPIASMRAFALAFKGDTTAHLVFKTKGASANPRQAAEMEAAAHSLGIAAQFTHISEYLPRTELDGLTGSADAYISLHKSEGFGLGMAEAMSQAIPVVATDWSANTEFCRPDTAWCVPYRMTPILPHEYPPAMKEWAEADVAAAAAALREIRADPAAARRRAERGRDFMAEHYSIARFKSDADAFLDGGAA